MNIKERPSHKLYIQALRRMTPEQRLMKAFELSELSHDLFKHGLRKRFPELSEEKIHQLYLTMSLSFCNKSMMCEGAR